MKTLGVSKIGKAKVVVDIVEKGNREIRPAYYMNPKKIAIHNTGNNGRGADAEAHNRYIHNQAGKPPSQTGYASWHFSVDDKYIYQHIPLDESAWHTGDGSGSTSGNRTAVGIEICENRDMDNYPQAEENAIALAVYLMKKLSINIQNVQPHQAFSGKYCPRVILGRDGSFSKFRNRIKAAYNGKPVPVTPVAGSSTSTASSASGNYAGKRVESIYRGNEGLNFYSKPSWDASDKVGVVPYGIGFPTVLDKVKVGSGYQYKVENSKGAVYYITASSDYVKLEGGNSTAAKPVAPVNSSGIKSVGKVKVANLKNFTYIYSKPSGNSSRLGKAKLGAVFNIAGSVSGWYEVIYDGKRAYLKDKYATRI